MMDRLQGLLHRLRAWLRPSVADRELGDELAFHVDMETNRLVREGLSPTAARREALISLGGVDRYMEAGRDARGTGWLDEARHDVRLALRLVRRNPQFTAAVVLTLGLGIGANTAIFSVVHTVLLRPWPFADVDRLVMVWETDRSSATSHEPASWPDVVDMGERSRTLEDIGVILPMRGTVVDTDGAERVTLLGVTPNLPSLLGVQPLIGRTFRAGEGSVQGAGYALLSEPYWRARFGGRSDIAGTTQMINGRPIEIVGVLPRDADLGISQVHARADYGAPLGANIDMWVALEPDPAAYPRQTHPFLTIARLRSGTTIDAAQEELAGIMADLEATFLENAARGVNLESYEAVTFGPVRRALLVLLGGVGVVLLVACVNVASLLLARTASRNREVAVRRALGASGGRISRQFLVESSVLALAGAACGLVIARIALSVLIALAPPDIPRLTDTSIDLRVLALATALSLGVAILFGMAPMLEARHLDLQRVLRAQAGRHATSTHDVRRYRSALVVAEVALAVVLVVTAGLLVRSFQILTAVDPGFRTSGILQAEYQLEPAARYPFDFARWPDLPEINTFHATLVERVRALPGVRSAALAAAGPLDAGFTNSFAIVGREEESRAFAEIRTRFITPGYLPTMDVPLLAGRDITSSDAGTADRVVLINESAATRYFPGTDPIDQRIRFWGMSWRIVGIMGDERFNGLDADPGPAVYASLAQAPQSSVVLLARTDGNPAALTSGIRDVLRELDPGLALGGVRTLENVVGESVARPRFVAVLLSLFAGLATVLALIGVHGVLSYSVTQRTHEIGIRLALGSTRSGVVRMVLRDAVTLAAAGTIIGIVGAAIVARSMAALLFGIHAHDAQTFLTAATAVVALAIVASMLPALRAARTQPMQALRTD